MEGAEGRGRGFSETETDACSVVCARPSLVCSRAMDGSVREGRAAQSTETQASAEGGSTVRTTKVVVCGVVMVKTGKECSGGIGRGEQGR